MAVFFNVNMFLGWFITRISLFKYLPWLKTWRSKCFAGHYIAVFLPVKCCFTSGLKGVSSGPRATIHVGPCYSDGPTLYCSLIMMWWCLGPLSSFWQISDADRAWGNKTWLSTGCLVVSPSDIDIIECCRVWHSRQNQSTFLHKMIL